MSKVFAGVQMVGPLAGVVRGSAPLRKKMLYFVGIRYAILLPILVKNCLILPPNKHRKTAFENERPKSDDPPFSLNKKVMTHPIFYRGPPPVEIMNGPLEAIS